MVSSVRDLALADNVCRQPLRVLWRHGNEASQAQVETKPGEKSLLHHHRFMTEYYLVVSGWGILTLGDAKHTVGPGEFAIIQPGTKHKLAASPASELTYLVTCVPAFDASDVYLDEEE